MGTRAATAGICMTLLATVASPALAEDQKPLLCAINQLLRCAAAAPCQEVATEAVGAPRFIQVDIAGKRVKNPEAGDEAPNSTVTHIERLGGNVIIQGTDPGIEGVRSGVGWTASLSDGDRRMVLTATGDSEAYVAFGSCIPSP